MTAFPVRKISIVAPDLVGGGMTRAYALAQALAHGGHAVEIIGIKLTTRPTYPVPPSNIKVREINGRIMLSCLLRLAAALDGDILYAIKPRLGSYGIALLKGRISRAPVMLDIDDWDTAELNERRLRRSAALAPAPDGRTGVAGRIKARGRAAVRRCLRWPNPAAPRHVRWMQKLIRKADAITVNTRFLQSLYGGTYVPQCKDAAKFSPDEHPADESRRRYGLAAYKVLMFPGTARAHKGLEDVLVALEALNDPDLRLVIVGGRHLCEDYVAWLKSHWGRWIVRLPAFSQEQMPDVVAAAHAVVVAQRDTVIARAQFPNKLTDAMAMAKPVITTSVGDIPGIIGDSAYLVEPSSPAQLALAVQEILDNPEKAVVRGRKGRERFMRCYSLDAVSPVLSGVVAGLVPASAAARGERLAKTP